MPVTVAKPQDFLALGSHGARIRALATVSSSALVTAETTDLHPIKAPATRLAGLQLMSDAALTGGSVAIDVRRINQDGTEDSLLTAPITANAALVSRAGLIDVPDTSIDTSKEVSHTDVIKITRAESTPLPATATLGIVAQFAPNGR